MIGLKRERARRVLQAAAVRACLDDNSHHGPTASLKTHTCTATLCSPIHPHIIKMYIHKTDKLIRVTLTTSGSCGDEYMSKRKKKGSELAAKYINFSHLICSRCEDMPVSSRELFLCFVTLTKAKFSCCDSELAYNYKKNPL